MLGELIARLLVLVLGYAYPAFECFKTVEKNRVEIEELRFWCQYWILVAVVTVLERVCDILISWVPMYGEIKLALFIYLWYPRTKGSGYVYDTLLKPYMSKHGTDIDRNLQEFRARAWDLLVYYWENCTQLGQTTVFSALDYLASHIGKLRQPSLKKTEINESSGGPPPAPSTPPAAPTTPKAPPVTGIFRRHRHSADRRQLPLPPASSYHAHRSVAHPTTSESVQVHLHDQTQYVRIEDPSDVEMDMDMGSDSGHSPKSKPKQHNTRLARLKFRLSKGFH